MVPPVTTEMLQNLRGRKLIEKIEIILVCPLGPKEKKILARDLALCSRVNLYTRPPKYLLSHPAPFLDVNSVIFLKMKHLIQTYHPRLKRMVRHHLAENQKVQ